MRVKLAKIKFWGVLKIIDNLEKGVIKLGFK
jgi:hypothetical protein